jgi:hypothetical protein
MAHPLHISEMSDVCKALTAKALPKIKPIPEPAVGIKTTPKNRVGGTYPPPESNRRIETTPQTGQRNR